MFLAVAVCSLMLVSQGDLVTGPVEVVAEDFKFTEGPVWLPSGRLAFSDTQGNTIYYADKTVLRKPSENSNGLAVDPEGRLICCQQGTSRALARVESDGTVTVLAERFEGKRLNGPNDLAVRSDGTIFFTDPRGRGTDKELDFSGVFALSPEGELTLLADDFNYPNGLAFSPDEKTLYIADTMKGQVRAFDVAEDGTLSNDRAFCKLTIPDGLKVDAKGRLWATSSAGMLVYDPEGELLETIKFPQWPSNCAFGDEDLKTLYVTARTALYKIRCAEPGIGAKALKE